MVLTGEPTRLKIITAHKGDLSKREAAHQIVSAIVAKQGRIDILVNATGGVRGQAVQLNGKTDYVALNTTFTEIAAPAIP